MHLSKMLTKTFLIPHFARRWNFLAETNLALRRTDSLLEQNSLMVVLLDRARTHFESDLS
jgi:hypothetical protein